MTFEEIVIEMEKLQKDLDNMAEDLKILDARIKRAKAMHPVKSRIENGETDAD